jgi:nucleotide-binding universal stress UspA family protein
MNATETRQSGSSPTSSPAVAPLIAVVGFDGSEASERALDAATQLIAGREGSLEVVYVAHMPTSASLSAPAEAGIREGFDDIVAELTDRVGTLLADREPRWHFHRRDGAVAHELLAAATDVSSHAGPGATVFVIVGASMHLLHHVAGSVPVALARNPKFPLLVAPWISPAEGVDGSATTPHPAG